MKQAETIVATDKYGNRKYYPKENFPDKMKTEKDKIAGIIINHMNAGNIELHGICVNELVKDIQSRQSDKSTDNALEDMVYQFGYRTVYKNQPAIMPGGLSALESAFAALGWDDPHILPEEGNTCEIKGCMNEISSGQHWDDLYLMLCLKHSAMLREGKKRSTIKKYARERESYRDKITGFLTKY